MATAASASAVWIPEDDLLLKNAIEAGASLEALAKGAVKFSRRFSYKEVQDRWHSLLYDPEISAQASVRMFELELSGFSPSSKSIKSEYYKGHRESSEKKKRTSIRKEYYAMRKRIQSEFLSSTGLEFLDDHDRHDLRERHSGNFISDNLGLQKADLDILPNVFPETVRDYASSSAFGGTNNTYSIERVNPIENDYPNRILRNEFPADASTSVRDDKKGSSVPDTRCLDISHTAKEPNFGKRPAVKVSGLVRVPPGKRLFRSSNKQLSTFDSADDNPVDICCGFGASEHLNSPDSEGNSSLPVIGFPSPQPNPPLWKTMEDFSSPPMPLGVSSQDTTRTAEMMLPDDVVVKEESSSVFDTVHSDPFVGVVRSHTDFMNSSVVSDGIFGDLSDSLLNLSNEDEVAFMEVDGKDKVDRSTYDNVKSPLQSSLVAVQEAHIVKLEPEVLMVGETKAPNDKNATKMETSLSSHSDQLVFRRLGINEPSTSGISPEGHELYYGIILCALNTEDPVIPCNDDIFLLIHPSSAFASSTTPAFSRDSVNPPASAADRKVNEQGLNLSSKSNDSSRSFEWPQNVRTSSSLQTRLAHPVVARSEKSELPDGKKASGDPSQVRPLYAISNIATDTVPVEDVKRAQSRGGDTLASLPKMPSCAEAGLLRIAIPEMATNATVSDPEESQSDDDMPYFSDIEAVILEMDLDPPDQDSSITQQVSRYQHEETKRTIIRLEQCARSCMQRIMTSREAFAMFYGRHLKHYMRKTEVVLGRSTDDTDVDIDLRKEGRANKISRRQAIIRMRADGSFSLKNVGKSAVSVNGKSVVTGQSIILSSSCLIEIRGMSFVFEINQNYVRRYLNVTSQKGS